MNFEAMPTYPDRIGMMILPCVSLFPGSLLPLYIFEERYREMTRLALAGNRMFAIAHALEDETIHPIGGLGIIRACVANPDGTSNLILQGVTRVEFSNATFAPRPEADIKILNDTENGLEAFQPMRNKIIEACSSNIQHGKEVPHGFEDYLHSMASTGAFTDIVASAMVEDPVQRRMLFEELNLKKRMQMLLSCLLENLKSA